MTKLRSHVEAFARRLRNTIIGMDNNVSSSSNNCRSRSNCYKLIVSPPRERILKHDPATELSKVRTAPRSPSNLQATLGLPTIVADLITQSTISHYHKVVPRRILKQGLEFVWASRAELQGSGPQHMPKGNFAGTSANTYG